MKKILIIGASILQLPAIKKAKELGYYVGVVDYNPNAIGINEADEYFNVSTIDIEGVTQVALRFKPDGIMTLATDMPMRAVARACEVCGLPGISYETSIKATDKGEMIQAFEEKGVSHPWFYIVQSFAELMDLENTISFPCVLKPTDNAGSRGVVLCKHKQDLPEKYEYALQESRSGSVIVEEYLVGPEFSVEVIVDDGYPHVVQITDKLTTGEPYFVEMGHSQPTCQPKDIQRSIIELACSAVKAVGIEIGPAHVEMILTAEGLKMVELGARLGGDCITTHLVPLSTGINIVECSIRLACGEKIDLTPSFEKGAAIRFFDNCNKAVTDVRGIEEAKAIPEIKEIFLTDLSALHVGEIKNSTDRMGYVISQAETSEKAIVACENAISKVEFIYD